MFKDIIAVIVVMAFVLGLVYLLATASEVGECKKWQEQAAKFEGFYLVQWQAEQCQAHNIIVNAPIK